MTSILGISAFYHDSAACILKNGEIVAAAQEERFTRKKHDSNYPKNAVEFVLKYSNLKLSEVFVSEMLLYFTEFPFNSIGREFLSIQFPSINNWPLLDSSSVIKYFSALGPLSGSVALNVISISFFSKTVFSSELATGTSCESNNSKTLTWPESVPLLSFNYALKATKEPSPLKNTFWPLDSSLELAE